MEADKDNGLDGSVPEQHPVARKDSLRPRHYVVLVALVMELLWFCFPPPGGLVERWYSQGLFRWIMAALSTVQDVSPVSLAGVFLVVFVLGVALFLLRNVRQLSRAQRSRWYLIPRFLGAMGQLLPLLLLWMLVLWGAGYQRAPVLERWKLETENLTEAERAAVQSQLLAVIVADMGGAATTNPERAIAAIASSMEQLVVARGERPIRLPQQVRATPPGFLLLTGTAGMCVPAVVEPLVDGAYDPVSFVQVAAHELGHVAGYNRESEATLLGYLAGLGAENALARYAVALDIYMDLIRRSRDQATYERAWEQLPDAARADVRRGREIASRYRINIALFQKLGYHVYDTYLKSQGIEEGMTNYSVGLRLFFGAWRQDLILERKADPPNAPGVPT